ncbi:MAG: MATE family efflux transporter [Lachnospiraceae bacterium]|nr:MATE family efflux transporter [Candidatus Darwinimomas equi]
MGTESTGKLLFSMSAPLCLSMLVQALYNIVDSIFVSRISEQALAATSLAFPIQSLMISFSVGMAVGMAALLSRSLGEGNRQKAQDACYNGIFIALCGAVVFLLFGLFGTKWYFSTQTSNPVIMQYGTDYLSIVCSLSIGFILEVTFERVLQATGNTFYNMLSQCCGAIFNCIFDPILIFGLCGLPAMGIKGAAIATVAGQFLAMILAIVFNICRNHDVSVIWKNFKPQMSVIREILSVGVPSFFMQAITSIVTYIMNSILIAYSEAAVTVYGVYFKLQSFILMPIFGMNSGMVPIIAYNYGAKKKDRIISTMKYAVIASTCIMLLGTLLFNIFPEWFMKLFNADGELLALGSRALAIISFHFIFAGFNIVVLSAYQALGNGTYALIISILRQIVILLPAAFILGKVFGINALWWCYPIAEAATTVVNIFLLRKTYNDKIKML